MLAHATLQPGAHLALEWPREFNALVYVLSGTGTVGADGQQLRSGQVAALGAGDVVVVDAAADGDEPLEVLLLGGKPFREPVFSYGPFVMNTKSEIIEAIDDFEAGKMGSIPPRVRLRTDEQGWMELEAAVRCDEREAPRLPCHRHPVDEVGPSAQGRRDVLEAVQVAPVVRDPRSVSVDFPRGTTARIPPGIVRAAWSGARESAPSSERRIVT